MEAKGRSVDKVAARAGEAVRYVQSGATTAAGGVRLCGIPSVLIDAVLDLGVEDLEAGGPMDPVQDAKRGWWS